MRDNDFLRNLVIAAGIFFAVLYVGTALMPPPRRGEAPPQPVAGTGEEGQTDQAPASAPSPAQTDSPAEAATAAAADQQAPPAAEPAAHTAFTVKEVNEEKTVFLGSPAVTAESGLPEGEDPYRMRLTLTNVGASVESATMTGHRQELDKPERYRLLSPVPEDDPRFRSLGIEKVNIEEVDVPLSLAKWSLRKSQVEGGEKAEFAIQIEENGTPALELIRTLTLPSQSVKSGRHDLYSDLTVRNVSDKPRKVIVTLNGGVGIRQIDPRMDYRVIDCGIRHPGGEVPVGERTKMPQVAKDEDFNVPLFLGSDATGGEELVWAATANKYFTCTLAPLVTADSGNGKYIASVEAFDIDKSSATMDDVSLRFVTQCVTLPPNESRSYPVAIYLGEKDHDSFKTIEEYKARNYYYQIAQDIPFCTFAPLVEVMVWLLNSLHSIWPHNFGLGIMVMVLIVRALLHPITKKGQVNMVRMQKKMGEFQPKIAELKKKYGKDKARLQQEQMKLYREEGINPAGQLLTCLPMMLQLPIWVALFYSLGLNISMRHQPFIWWIKDLTAPDALHTFNAPINLIFTQIEAFNLLPILLAIAMYVQQKLMPKPKPNPNATDQQKQQQEMMQKMGPLMAIMMLVFFYKAPSGLTLYIMSSTVLGSVEQWYIRKHIRQHEEAGTLLKPNNVKEGGMAKRPGGSRLKKPGWLGRLQAAAEQAQKQRAKK
jgi:YidC/Oxa1 family membrane protein insertase